MELNSTSLREIFRSRTTSKRNCVASEIITGVKTEVKSRIPELITTRNELTPPACFPGGEHAQLAYEKLACNLFTARLTPGSGPVIVRETRTLQMHCTTIVLVWKLNSKTPKRSCFYSHLVTVAHTELVAQSKFMSLHCINNGRVQTAVELKSAWDRMELLIRPHEIQWRLVR